MTLEQWSQTQFLEGHSSVQFSSNQLQLIPAWQFLAILISWIRCVLIRVGAKLRSCGPPGIEFETNALELMRLDVALCRNNKQYYTPLI